MAADWLLYLAAAVETVLLAALALLVSRVEPGGTIAPAFLRLNAALLGPFGTLPLPVGGHLGGAIRQLAAILGYGLIFSVVLGGLSWFGRRQALS